MVLLVVMCYEPRSGADFFERHDGRERGSRLAETVIVRQESLCGGCAIPVLTGTGARNEESVTTF